MLTFYVVLMCLSCAIIVPRITLFITHVTMTHSLIISEESFGTKAMTILILPMQASHQSVGDWGDQEECTAAIAHPLT